MLRIDDPLDRIVHSSTRPLNLPGAIARFIWMMGANDRLKDIEFYWGSRVTSFSDDGIIVPGSSYGQRILHARPGVDQLQGCIARLKEDPQTRRAAISIYQAEDTLRASKDIPCTFGLCFHIRNKCLHAGVSMRSNNAFVLFPYNIFEFSLLSEIIAAECGVPFASLTYSAMSMHIYDGDRKNAQNVADESEVQTTAFPPMPRSPLPMEQIRELVKLEAEARHVANGLTRSKTEEWVRQASNKLDPYWCQFFYLLLIQMCSKYKLRDSVDYVAELISPIYRPHIPSQYLNFEGVNAESRNGFTLLGDSDGPLRLAIHTSEGLQAERTASLEKLCSEKSRHLINAGKLGIGFDEFLELRTKLISNTLKDVALAARGTENQISQDEFGKAFSQLPGRR